MTARSVALSAMLGWLPETLRILKAGWRRLISASVWMLLVIFVPIGLFFGLAFATGGLGRDPAHPLGDFGVGLLVGYGVLALASFLVQPALMAGWFGVCGDIDVGRSGRGRDIFAPFRQRGVWGRSLGVMLVTLGVTLLVFCVTLLPFLGNFIAFDQAMTAYQANQSAGQTVAATFPPIGFFLGYFVFLIAMIVVQLVSMVAMAEVAARPTPALAAMRLAAQAVLRNLFKLVLVYFIASAVMGAVVMVVLLPVILLGLGLMLLSQVLGIGVIVLGYAAMLVTMYPLMFAFQYLVWKGLLAAEAPAAVEASVSA